VQNYEELFVPGLLQSAEATRAIIEGAAPTVSEVELDNLVAARMARDSKNSTGSVDVRVEILGEHIWRGFDAWIDQTEFKDSWGRNWLTAYNRGLIDYYVVTADKK
jgi:hypothetical protein